MYDPTSHHNTYIHMRAMHCLAANAHAPHAHSLSVSLQLSAFRSLSQSASALVMGTGGLNRLFAAMDNHVLAYNVQEGACVVLYNLAMAPENRAEIVDAGGILRLRRAATKTPPAFTGSGGTRLQAELVPRVLKLLLGPHSSHGSQ